MQACTLPAQYYVPAQALPAGLASAAGPLPGVPTHMGPVSQEPGSLTGSWAHHALPGVQPGSACTGQCMAAGAFAAPDGLPSPHIGRPGANNDTPSVQVASSGSRGPQTADLPSAQRAWLWNYVPLKKQHQLPIKPTRLLHVPSYLAEEHMDIQRCVRDGLDLKVEIDGVLEKRSWPVTLSVYKNTSGYIYYRIGGTRQFATAYEGWIMQGWFCASPTCLLLILTSRQGASKGKVDYSGLKPHSKAKAPPKAAPKPQPSSGASALQYMDVPPPESGVFTETSGELTVYVPAPVAADASSPALELAASQIRDSGTTPATGSNSATPTTCSASTYAAAGDLSSQPAESHRTTAIAACQLANEAPGVQRQMMRVPAGGLQLLVSANGQLVAHVPNSPMAAATGAVNNSATPQLPYQCHEPGYGTGLPVVQQCAMGSGTSMASTNHIQQPQRVVWMLQPQSMPTHYIVPSAPHQHVIVHSVGTGPEGGQPTLIWRT